MYRCCATNGRRLSLVIAMVGTPGATAYLLTDQFKRLAIIAICIGTATSAVGALSKLFLLMVLRRALSSQCKTAPFLLAFLFAPKHGMLAARRRARQSSQALISQSPASKKTLLNKKRCNYE